MKELISRLDQQIVAQLQPTLKKLANMFNPEIDPLALYVRKVLNKIHQRNYGQLCSLTRKGSERSLSDLLAAGADTSNVAVKDELQRVLRTFANGNGDDDLLLLHEFFFTGDADTNRCAVYLFIQKTFHVPPEEIIQLQTDPTQLKGANIFRFEIRPRNPLYSFYQQKAAFTTDRKSDGRLPRFVYFLNVLSELDLLRNRTIIDVLKRNSNKDDQNTFLFVAYPRGENGFSQAITLPEQELQNLGKALRDEMNKTLSSSDVGVQDVDLMLSRPAHPPVYATQFDFSAKDKLELCRLPEQAENLTVPNSPFMIFRINDTGVSRLFVRRLIRDLASVLYIDKYATKKTLDLLQEKIVDLLDGTCGEVRVCIATDKSKTATYDCNHALIRLDYQPELSTEGWHEAIEAALLRCEKVSTSSL
jgi:hypothetical protein